MSRIKAMVLALFAAYWVIVLVILVAAPDVYLDQLSQEVRLSGDPLPVEIGSLLVLTIFFSVLSLGVTRGWRWLFWLLVAAFLIGVLHVPASALELAGIVPRTGPVWYVVLQAVISLVQFGIGLAMVAHYRKSGVW